MEQSWWPELKKTLIEQFQLGPFTAHDQDHWRRVEGYGLYLGQQLGADLEVVRLFAWIHDSRREEEGHDPEHGSRAAVWAEKWCGKAFLLRAEQLALLSQACRYHEAGQTSEDITVGVCWDSDRLDLDRVGKSVDPDFLSTEMGRNLASMRPKDRRRLAGMG